MGRPEARGVLSTTQAQERYRWGNALKDAERIYKDPMCCPDVMLLCSGTQETNRQIFKHMRFGFLEHPAGNLLMLVLIYEVRTRHAGQYVSQTTAGF